MDKARKAIAAAAVEGAAVFALLGSQDVLIRVAASLAAAVAAGAIVYMIPNAPAVPAK